MPGALKIAVVGQGIAGTVLALHLAEQGAMVKAFDVPDPTSASRVAAGMWNPVSFKTLKPLWNAASFCDAAKDFYTRLEAKWHRSFYHEMRMQRIFHSAREANDWTEKSIAPQSERFMRDDDPSHLRNLFTIPFGTGCVHGSGWLNIPEFFRAAGEVLDISTKPFDYTSLQWTEENVSYQGESFDHIIFCEGIGVKNNPWFSALPVRPNKGQVVTLDIPGTELNEIVHFGHFLLHTGGSSYRLGATYEGDAPPVPTEEGREALTRELTRVLQQPYSVTRHQAGIRPTVPDRRPICGPHPVHQRLSVFNGFGSRGVLYAPWCAMHMAQHLLEGTVIPAEISAGRYRKYLTA